MLPRPLTCARRSLIAVLLCAVAGPALAHSDDAVRFKNGNRLDGEIKKLDHNVLSFDTDSADVLKIDWDDVMELTGPGLFKVELTDGTQHFGPLVPASAERLLAIETEAGTVEVQMTSVFAIGSVDTVFWDKVGAYLNFGFSYTSASEVTQLSFSGGINYTERNWRADLTASSITTTQTSAEDTSKNDLNASYRRSLGNRWFAIGGVGAQQNTALGLELRGRVYGGGGRRFVQTNSQLFSGWVGLAATHDEPSGVGESMSDLTGVVSLTYEIFVGDSPSTSLNTTVSAYPYITQSGRWRVDYDLTLRKEIISDFYWDLSFFTNYDNEPASLGAETTDYGIVTSLGYSF